jgi:tRNA(Ile)-lysidine synthase
VRQKEFAARVWSKLVAFEKQHALLPPKGRVLAAISGGPDSTALAHWLSVQSKKKGFEFCFLHVNHGLRPGDADQDAHFVRELGHRFNCQVFVVRADVRSQAKKRGLGLEEAGRKARYHALVSRAHKGRFNAVAVGHHLDDQAETILLHLLRGTSFEGLGAMAPKRPLAKGISLIRPLLPLTRDEVMTYLEIHGLS